MPTAPTDINIPFSYVSTKDNRGEIGAIASVQSCPAVVACHLPLVSDSPSSPTLHTQIKYAESGFLPQVPFAPPFPELNT